MRVIEASSVDQPTVLELINIEPDGSSPYAILSHTWGADGDEVSYTDVLNKTARRRPTFEAKVAHTCRRALADGLQYVWVDTCCIDKSSSAELSEAINSMFQWYRGAAICYVLLSDVPADTVIDSRDSPFARARWFQRGFTLQELIAPAHVVFYSQDWTELGTKVSLSRTLASLTSIDVDVLVGTRSIESTSIANRMGWAANRKTKRPEDVAYCLMGIFAVNMPLLYGEGSKAFIRLQEEIMKSSTDHSLFAWVDTNARDDDLCGVLAKSPSVFKRTSMIIPYRPWVRRKPYSMTNMGLSIELVVNQATKDKELYIAGFDCPTTKPLTEEFFGIYLKRLDTSTQDLRFARIKAGNYLALSAYEYSEKSHVYLSVDPTYQDTTSLPSAPLLQAQLYFSAMRCSKLYDLISFTLYPGVHVHRSVAFTQWPVTHVYLRRGANRVTCALQMKYTSSPNDRVIVLIGTDHNFQPAFSAFNLSLDLGNDEFPANTIPTLDELEMLYQPKPLGETVDMDMCGENGKTNVGRHAVSVAEVLQRDNRGYCVNVFMEKLPPRPSQPSDRSKAGDDEGQGKWWKMRKIRSMASMNQRTISN